MGSTPTLSTFEKLAKIFKMPNNVLWLRRLERQGHPYHIVNRSPWPFFLSIGSLSITVGAVLYMHRYQGGGSLLFWGLVATTAIMLFWFRDVIVEATYEGQHTKKVQAGLRLGMKLFIITEVMFFFSFFWAFFHSALAPHTFIGVMWPPRGVIPYYIDNNTFAPETDLKKLEALYESKKNQNPSLFESVTFENWVAWEQPTHFEKDRPHLVKIKECVNTFVDDNGLRWAFCYLPLFNPYTIPLAATFILLSSGLTLHIAGMWFKFASTPAVWPYNASLRTRLYNMGIKLNKTTETLHTPSRSAAYYAIAFWLSATIALGLIFTIIQAYEYIVLLPFSINDSVFGSCFYMLTGFHGFHVILGTIGLMICLYRHFKGHFTENVHVGFECASWYWHFVDGVWLFVYSIVYWWSAPLKKPYLWYDENGKLWSCGEGKAPATWDQIQKLNTDEIPQTTKFDPYTDEAKQQFNDILDQLDPTGADKRAEDRAKLQEIIDILANPEKQVVYEQEWERQRAWSRKYWADKKAEEEKLQNKGITETTTVDQKIEKEDLLDMEKIITIIREELKKAGADTLSDETVELYIRTIQKDKLRGRPRNPDLVWDIHPLSPKVREVHWSMLCSPERAQRAHLAYQALSKPEKANLHRLLECTYLSDVQKMMVENVWNEGASVVSYKRLVKTHGHNETKELLAEYEQMFKFLECYCLKLYGINTNDFE